MGDLQEGRWISGKSMCELCMQKGLDSHLLTTGSVYHVLILAFLFWSIFLICKMSQQLNALFNVKH